MVRRTLYVSSALVAALSLVWSATSVSAGALAVHVLPATSQHAVGPSHHTARTQASGSAAVSSGTAPTLLQSQAGTSEASAVSAAGTSGNPQVTTPADPSIAVGPNNVVEAVNSALEITSRTGAAPVDMNISAMIVNTSGFYLQYPHVMYDPASGLFILMVLQFNKTLSSCVSQIAVMVSQANPTLTWTDRGTINIDPELGGGMELSNLSVGLTGSVVVESSDYESCSTGHPVASQTVVIRRADLTSGAFTGNTYAFIEPGPLGLQPAMALSAQTVDYEVANDASCTVTGNVPGSVAVFAIEGLPVAGAITTGCTSEAESPATSAPPAAPQEGTAATLTTGNDRFLSAVWLSNVLWVAGNTSCTPSGDTQPRPCLNVDTIAATSTGSIGAFTDLPVEGVSGFSLYDPAIAVDNAGDAIVTFDKSSASSFESMMVAAVTGGTWSSLVTLHTSANFYSPSGCTSCQWGDYSAAVQDASHPTDVWVLSEDIDVNTVTATCPTANSCWNTYIGRYTFAGPVISSLSPAAGPASGGELVTVNGSDFAPGSTVTFNSAPITPATLTPDSFTFTTPVSSTSGLVQAQVSDSLGTSPITLGSGYIYVGLANYVPVSPFRILDTRVGKTCIQCSEDPTFGPNTTRTLQLVGVTGLSVTDPILSTATAVVLNVTEVAGTANSLLTVYPYGTAKPQASNLNFAPGTVIANLVTVTLGQGGDVSIYNALGTVNVLADVEGYFEPSASTVPTGEFHPMSPLRVCDTRSTSPTAACKAHGEVGSGASMVVNVTGTAAGAIPDNGTAEAVVVNLTGVAGSALTYLSLFPTNSSGQCVPTGTSTINLSAGQVAANRVMVPLGPATSGGVDTSLCVYNAAGIINVVIDAGGWFGSGSAAAGAQYQAIQPTRICDTRVGSPACLARAIAGGTAALVVVAGQGTVPALGSGTTAVAVIANLTAIAPTAATYLTVYPANVGHPLASDINVTAGEVLPNLVVVQIDTVAGAGQGDVDIYNAAGSVNAILDIEGWFQ